MSATEKLDTLAAAAKYDVCGYDGMRHTSEPPLHFIYRAAMPGGKSICLFKVLLTNICSNDCVYCVNQVGRDHRRTSFQPDEMARLFMQLYDKKLVQGLFLSSAIPGNASRTMEEMVKTVEILRHRYAFDDYVHLKILPGSSPGCIEAGCRLANRVSVNIEAPTAQYLARLSSQKDIYRGILEPMRLVKKLRDSSENLLPSGQTTQFVVGAAGETDRDILHTSAALYREVELRRVYFSAFQPITGTTLEGTAPTPPLREHRLYQADWLLRVYKFSPAEVEMALGSDSNLLLRHDPKLTIARKQPWLFPVDVNRASYDELIRVPGIGPLAAGRIVAARREHSINSLQQLKKLHVLSRAAPFIWFKGMLALERQTSFLSEIDEARAEPALAAVG